MVKHLQSQKLEDLKGSPSIADNAETAVAHELMSSFKKGKNIRITGPKTKNTSRPKNKVRINFLDQIQISPPYVVHTFFH